ncbi:DUF4265 domain-containing protein [Pectobacterium parmentieri]|uniref:DUF4265 domain-containing protein n=1 Tax=Pectobacterium parmentieri TaxID=1905730 RepID=A0A8B3GA16_PECPM|nr:DUF4265 domain-containing protein [Pectobacterium parmentieri]AOR60351.1 hypothetical protein A8F97_15840 [Pectobacterium parmentieri]AYG99943.1 DUF4265 domain-containing protein [Pectobacterium parmentieri]AYH04426.1 DUF4265 domain-containing protein [Pectobacterium parmentieri]AYH08698.1 DUF4265 domain-containing protein [Pectobacterium parmentieri]AYH13248.1 DUF4265 domain-containing protein [Pectobacterium parmentieri]
MLVHIYVANNDDGPVFEQLPVREIEKETYELLSSPGLALNLARGDIFRIKGKHTHPEVLKRGGNFCIHIYADELPPEDITRLEDEVLSQLNGTLDGIFEGNLTLAVPARNGMDKIADVLDAFREKTGIEWYFSNIYKNIDDDEDETLLYWWLDS